MPPLEKKDISFESADGRSTISGVIWHDPAVEPWCVLQISHGMCEYILRYRHFAAFLAANGVAVCGNDHIGHGASAQSPEDLGYFSEQEGRRFALEDLHTMNQRAREAWPGLPLVLLGHSMGSFFARRYATQWPETIDGLIISGTGGPNPLAGFGIALTKRLIHRRGGRHRSKRVQVMAFGNYLSRIEEPKTPYDWISRDEAVVAAYVRDPLCTFRFTVNGFHELFSALREVSGPDWAAAMPRDKPILMFSGDADPVGDYGKGVMKVYDWLREAGVKDLRLELYPGGRHEMLNEVNRQEVYDDVLRFLQGHWAPAAG